MLKAEGIYVRFKGLEAVRDVSLGLVSGQWLMLAGPNGAGKSSLLKALAQSLPYQGKVWVSGKEAKTLSPRQLALNMAVLEQSHQVGYAYTVEQLVSLGRYARQGPFSKGDPEGADKVGHALSLCGLIPKRNQNVLTLSGGELQRAFLAQVFAQDAPLLLLDEPASHLDPAFARTMFELIEAWLKTPGRAVLSVVHDLQLARHYGTHTLLMAGGRVVASGEKQAVFTRHNLMETYGEDVAAWLSQLAAPWRDGQNGRD